MLTLPIAIRMTENEKTEGVKYFSSTWFIPLCMLKLVQEINASYPEFLPAIVPVVLWILFLGAISAVVLAILSCLAILSYGASDEKSDRDLAIGRAVGNGIYAVISFVMWLIITLGFPPGIGENQGSSVKETTAALLGKKLAEPSGLTLEQLELASQTVDGYWKEEDPLFDDENDWLGTSGVISANWGTLTLVTNSHVLNVDSLASADHTDPHIDPPEIIDYQLVVTFASGAKRNVLNCGDLIGTKDLALLKVDARGLVEGRDYVLLPIADTDLVSTGDDVVAVGSPVGLRGTHTFGKISAVRNYSDHGRCFQTDAAINFGNSGGPLFRKVNERHFWIGVNTFGFDGDNLGFALDAQSVSDSDYHWFNGTAQGVAAYISRHYIGQ